MTRTPVLAVGRSGAGPLQLSGAFGDGSDEVVVDLTDASGRSPEERWPRFHPGPLDPTSGWRGHRVAAVLDVPEDQRSEAFVLRLAFAASHGPCPDLLVDLDGRTGLLRPQVVRRDRSEVFRQSPVAGSVDLEVALPGSWLAPGRHRLTITTALDGAPQGPPAHERRRPREQHGTWFGSGITWDSLSITAAPSSVLPRRPTVSLSATPLVARTQAGPRQLLDLRVDLVPGGEHDPAAVVEIAGERHDVALPVGGCSFGQAWARFGVPELARSAGPTTADVAHAGERTSHEIAAPRRWTVHLVPHVHLDVGFTDHQGDVLELHSRNLDRSHAALAAEAAPGEGFRLSVDGAVVVRDHLATRRAPVAERTLHALRSGRVSVNAFHSLFLSGVASLEECYRATYLSAGLREQHGVPVTYANLTDVPSYSAALPGILRDLGIDGFVGLANHGRAATADSDEIHLRSPFVWEGLDGQGVLTHVADSYSQLRFMAGDPQTLPGAAQAFERYLGRYERADYLPSDIAVVGTHADNEDLADGDTSLVPRWNAAYAWPRMVVSTLADHLDAVRPLRDRLPVWRGDGGSFWEDGVGAAATAIAVYRRAQTLLPVAEGLGALVGVASGTWRPDRTTLDAGWDALLIGCEHTWTWSHAASHPGAHQAHDQLAWKRHRIGTAWRTGTDETRRGMSQLGELVATTGPSLLVHNPLSWARGVDVEVEVPRGVRPVLGGPAGSAEVPCEVLADVDGLDRLRLSVPDVPAFGWRTLDLPPAGRGPAPDAAPDLGWQPLPGTLRAGRWEVGTDPVTGMVRRLVHLPSGRSLLDAGSPWPLGTVLHAAHVPTGGPDSLQDRRPAAPEPVLDVEPATMRPVGARRTHDGWRLRWEGVGRTLPQVVLEVLLRGGSDVVDVSVHLEKEASLAKEGVYVAFPFAAQDPTVRYDRQQGWVDPAVDHSPGACNEWFTTQHGVVVSSGRDGPAVAWSSREVPLFTVGDVVRGRWPETFTPTSAAVLSWVMNNYWTTNTPPSQEGPLDLRWSFAPMERFDAAAAARLGRELRWPAVTGEVTWWDKFDTGPRPLPPTGSLLDLGLCEVDARSVHVTVGQTRDGRALVVRLAELAGRERRLGLRHPSGAGGVAHLARADDRPREPLAVGDDGAMPVTLRPWSVVTLRLAT